LMEPAIEPLSAAISETAFATPRFPIASNVTGTLVTDPAELRALAERQVVSPVRWEASLGALREFGADAFVEAGPGDVLTRLAKRAAPGARAVAVGSPEAASELAREHA
jgi:[acyl-carrier-protein] S-malonyltransferase